MVEGEDPHLRAGARLSSYQSVLVLISLLVIVEDGCAAQTVKCEAQSEQHH